MRRRVRVIVWFGCMVMGAACASCGAGWGHWTERERAYLRDPHLYLHDEVYRGSLPNR